MCFRNEKTPSGGKLYRTIPQSWVRTGGQRATPGTTYEAKWPDVCEAQLKKLIESAKPSDDAWTDVKVKVIHGPGEGTCCKCMHEYQLTGDVMER